MSRPKVKAKDLKKPRTVKITDKKVRELIKKSKEKNLSKAIRIAIEFYLTFLSGDKDA